MRWRPTALQSLLLIAVSCAAGTIGYDEYLIWCGARDGLTDARADINSGTLRLKWGGHAKPWRPNVIRLFKDRYDVDVQYVYGCNSSWYQPKYAGAYNTEISRHITAVRGSFPIEQLEEEARKESRK